jgi:hypothetical protein
LRGELGMVSPDLRYGVPGPPDLLFASEVYNQAIRDALKGLRIKPHDDEEDLPPNALHPGDPDNHAY